MDNLKKLLNEISDLEQSQTNAIMQIAAMIEDYQLDTSTSNEDLAELLNVSKETLTDWMAGTHDFKVSELILLEHKLNLNFLT